MANELFVDDEYFLKAAEYLERSGQEFEEKYDAYIQILEKAAAEGMISGKAADTLRSFTAQAIGLKGEIPVILSIAAQNFRAYIQEIENIDHL